MLIGEHLKTRAGGLRFSPFLFSQNGIENRLLLPQLRDLPLHGLTFASKTFDFGFNPPNPSLAPYDTAYQTVTCVRNILIWGILGVSSPARGSAAVSPAYLFQFLHSHKGKQRQWFNKSVTDGEAAGTAQEPHILREPQLILAGDQLQIQMQNLGNVTLNAQVALLGGEFD